jgi:translation initiation factor eIF-2B subunit delta
VERVLCFAVQAGVSFRVIIADSRPGLEGRKLLHRLAQLRVNCTYILLSGLSYVMKVWWVGGV